MFEEPALKEEAHKPKTNKNCFVCGRECEKISGWKKYCCLDVPINLIKKPVGEWMCGKCSFRVSYS